MKLVTRSLILLVTVTIEVIWQMALLSQFRHQIWETQFDDSNALSTNMKLDLIQSCTIILLYGKM